MSLWWCRIGKLQKAKKIERDKSNPLFLFGGDSRTLNPVLRQCQSKSKLFNRKTKKCKHFRDSSLSKFSSKNKERDKPSLSFLVETVELESTTPCMSSKYSNQLSYASICRYYYIIILTFVKYFGDFSHLCSYFLHLGKFDKMLA